MFVLTVFLSMTKIRFKHQMTKFCNLMTLDFVYIFYLYFLFVLTFINNVNIRTYT